eukprot:PITA_22836
MAQNQPNTQTSTLQYPIVDSAANAPMEAIPLQHIPTFHGLTSEDPNAFLFEFDVLCKGYDYTTDPQKLKLFPSTLKGAALRWFMGLGGGVINNWDQMKESFLKKYQDYCRSRELKDEIFQMIARPNETLEEYVEHFQYNLQISPYASLPLPDNVLKTTLIRGMKEQWIETLNIMGNGDIYQEGFADIIDLCIRSSRGSTRVKPAEHDRFLSSGRIIETVGDKTVQVEDQLPREHLSQEEDVNKQQTHNQATTSSPLFPERLVIPRPIQYLDFDILGELQNLYIKIPFLQAIQGILIYAKTIKELCIKKQRRNITSNPRVQVVGTLSDLLSGKATPTKYEDPGNPIVTIQIYGQTLSNALVDLGAEINILTTTTYQKLGITFVEPTSTLLELADRSVVRPEGTLHDVMVSIDSWEYPTSFLIINPKT